MIFKVFMVLVSVGVVKAGNRKCGKLRCLRDFMSSCGNNLVQFSDVNALSNLLSSEIKLQKGCSSSRLIRLLKNSVEDFQFESDSDKLMIAYGGKNVTSVMCCKENKNRRRKEKKEIKKDPVMCYVAEPSAEYLPHTTLLSPSYIQALKRAELGYGEYCETSYYMRNCTHGRLTLKKGNQAVDAEYIHQTAPEEKFMFTKAQQTGNYFEYYCNTNECNGRFDYNFTCPKPVDPDTEQPTHPEGAGQKLRTFLRGLAAVMGLVSLSWVAAVTYTLKGKRKEKDTEQGSTTTAEESILDLSDNELIKRGRFASLYLVDKNEEKVVVKQFTEIKSFEREHRAYKALGQHALLCYCESISTPSRHLTLRYYSNGNLRQYLQSDTITKESAESSVVSMILDITGALSYLHGFDIHTGQSTEHRFCHRDIKPTNFLVNELGHCVLTDFDLALDLSNIDIEDSPKQVGTLLYMSPELLDCNVSISPQGLTACDLYSMGLVLWELAAYLHRTRANMTPTYRPVFSDHLPVHYTREDFIHLVIVKKVKPSLPKSDCEVINLLKSTVEECLDYDCESRLSAHCVYNRVKRWRDENRPEAETTENSTLLPRKDSSKPLAMHETGNENISEVFEKELSASSIVRVMNPDTSEESLSASSDSDNLTVQHPQTQTIIQLKSLEDSNLRPYLNESYSRAIKESNLLDKPQRLLLKRDDDLETKTYVINNSSSHVARCSEVVTRCNEVIVSPSALKQGCTSLEVGT